MATASFTPEPVRIQESTVKRYVSYWTIEEWSAYLNKEKRSPLKERLQTEQLSWNLELACNVGPDRKPDAVGLCVLAELEREATAKITAEGCCSLLDLKSKADSNPWRQAFSRQGNISVILMDVPVEDVLATQELDEIKIRIELAITEPLSSTTLTIEEMTSLPKGVYDRATTDAVIMVEDMMIPAHQSVLAKSSLVFKSQLRVATWKRVDLTDVDLYTAKELMSFVYTKRTPDFQGMDISHVCNILNAAETYGWKKLKKRAEEHIASNLHSSDAINILLWTSRNRFLKETVLQFIKNNKYNFSKYEYCRLRHRPDLMADIIEVMGS